MARCPPSGVKVNYLTPLDFELESEMNANHARMAYLAR
jgi:hypothetical protein